MAKMEQVSTGSDPEETRPQGAKGGTEDLTREDGSGKVGKDGGPETGDDATAGAEEEAQPEKREGEEEPGTGEVTEEIEEGLFEKLEDGTYQFTVDPDDPNSTVYRGKSITEVLKEIKKGVLEKDRQVREARTRKAVSPEKFAGKKGLSSGLEPSAEHEIEYPDEQEILLSMLKRERVDAVVLTWGNEEWKAFETEHGTRAAIKAEERLDKIREQARVEFDRRNVAAVNDANLFAETDAVVKMLSKAKVEMTEDEYDELLSGVLSDKANFTKTGVRKPGAITAAVADFISDRLRKSAEQGAERKANEKVAKAALERSRGGVVVKATTGRATPGTSEKVPKTREEATAQVTKMLAARLKSKE